MEGALELVERCDLKECQEEYDSAKRSCPDKEEIKLFFSRNPNDSENVILRYEERGQH